MIFHPQNSKTAEGRFTFRGNIKAIAHPCLSKDIIKEFWSNFTYQSSTLSISECDDFVFMIGNAEKKAPHKCAYSINIEPSGLCVCAGNEKDLISGYMTLLDRFKATDIAEGVAIELDCGQLSEQPLIQNRMVHFCIFPETELWELQRFVRFCGALKYTHIILEFWGMLKYDCMQELSWSFGFTKEQIRPIIREAKDLGLEIVPMFNHWGHASGSRVIHGKHVVLDQNPALQTYFSEDGWCWDIRKPKVRKLLREIRDELCLICGEGKYFHIGCDEPYHFDPTEEILSCICSFINETSDEMNEKGRRIIAWGDMLLYRLEHYSKENRYYCLAPTPDSARYMMEHIDRSVIIADWQYECPRFPVETAITFKEAGFDCLLCPWDRGSEQTRAALATVKEYDLCGFIHTTWNTLSHGMPFITLCALGGFESTEGRSASDVGTCSAALLRKVMPTRGDYRRAGWSKVQIMDRC